MIHKNVIYQTTTHRKCSPCLIRLCLLLAVALTLAVPASAEWKEKVLYSFQGGTNDGALPVGGVVFDSQGNLYGVLQFYGPGSCGPIANECGVVFQLAPPAHKGDSWTETLLYEFKGKGGNDGESPNGGLVIDGQGNLYGVTAYGGTGDCVLLGVPAGCGTVYEVSPPAEKGGAWTETILYSFPTAKQGYVPNGDLVFDRAGNLYGATMFGGGKGTTCDEFYGGQCGVVFELSPLKKSGAWAEKVLHNFAGGTDGANPNGGLLLDIKGEIYGTTAIGGNQICQDSQGHPIGCGIVFQLRQPSKEGGVWTEKIMHRFTEKPDGAGPNGGLIFDAKGSLYGTAGGGGKYESGVVFRLSRTAKGQWVESVLYDFTGGDDGQGPNGPLRFDSAANLYGTAIGGAHFSGVVFRLSPPSAPVSSWIFNLLYSFLGTPDGHYPANGLVIDGGDHLYGTTEGGGTAGDGTVFSVWP
jgi:uncharacterized repeat protein (TIGR03803 family)